MLTLYTSDCVKQMHTIIGCICIPQPSLSILCIDFAVTDKFVDDRQAMMQSDRTFGGAADK